MWRALFEALFEVRDEAAIGEHLQQEAWKRLQPDGPGFGDEFGRLGVERNGIAGADV